MSELDDLKGQVAILERFVMKHLAHLYAKVEPAEVPTTLDGMKSIYTNRTSPKPRDVPPMPQGRKELEPMTSIYTNATSPKARKQ
jgi:hypothetical protein